MFGLTFDFVALVNATAGGFVGAILSLAIALVFYRRSIEQARRAANDALQAFEMTARFLDSFADQSFRALGIRDLIRVTWSKDSDGRITNANVIVSIGVAQETDSAGAVGSSKSGDKSSDTRHDVDP